MKNLPRHNSEKVKEILASDITIVEKARAIHSYDFNLLCRENSGVFKQMPENEIIGILKSL